MTRLLLCRGMGLCVGYASKLQRLLRPAMIVSLIAGSLAVPAFGQVVVNPGEDFAFVQADSCRSDTIVPNLVKKLARANSTCDAGSRRIKAEVRPIVGPEWVGFQTVQARSFLQNDFEVGAGPQTAGNTVGAWVTYDVDFNGLMVFIGFFSNPTVEVAMTMTDLTQDKVIKGELIWSRDGKGFGVSIPYIPIDFNFGGGHDDHAVTNTFSTVLTRGHAYRLELRLVCSVFSDGGLDVGSECDYMDDFLVGNSGAGVGWTRLAVKVGLDEAEVLQRLAELEQHTHIYLTGRGIGHNNTPAETSPPTDASGQASTPEPPGQKGPGKKPGGNNRR
jgi:hypothetical protein